MFLGFSNSLARSRYLSFFSLCFNFTLWSTKTAKSTFRQVPFLLLLLGLRVWPRLDDPFVSQNIIIIIIIITFIMILIIIIFIIEFNISLADFSLEFEGQQVSTYHPSRKLSKLQEPDMQDTAGEVGKNS